MRSRSNQKLNSLETLKVSGRMGHRHKHWTGGFENGDKLNLANRNFQRGTRISRYNLRRVRTGAVRAGMAFGMISSINLNRHKFIVMVLACMSARKYQRKECEQSQTGLQYFHKSRVLYLL